VTRGYARGLHWDERVDMMIWWANYLDELRLDDAKADSRARRSGRLIFRT
jgi:hypothetical protein